MSDRFHLVTFCIACLGLAVVAERTNAADSRRASHKTPKPILVVNATSVDRVLTGADGLLKMVDRQQWSLALKGLLAVSTNGLKGIDRRRPFGVLTFINAGIVPEPVGVLYVPVTSGDEFLASLKTLEFAIKPADGISGGYTATAHKQTFALRLRGNYAFLARSLESLKREFGDPAVRFADLSRAFDVSIRFDLDATPAGMKAMVLDYARASAELSLEIRRGESPAAFKLRKAIGMAALSGFEETVRDGKSLTLGLTVPKSSTGLSFVARLEARAGTPLANGLNDLQADRKQTAATGPRSAGFRLATNWKPPSSLIPVFNAIAPKKPTNAGDADAGWNSLRQGLFTTGIRLVAWSSITGVAPPATVAVVSFPNAKTAAAQVRGALALFLSRGLVKSETVPVAGHGRKTYQRLTWQAATGTAGAVALIGNSAWIAVGRGKVLDLLQSEQRAIGAAKTVKPDGQTGTLIQLSGPWSVVKSFLQSGSWPQGVAGRSTADRFELAVTHRPNILVVRSLLPATAVREATAPLLKRLLPR